VRCQAVDDAGFYAVIINATGEPVCRSLAPRRRLRHRQLRHRQLRHRQLRHRQLRRWQLAVGLGPRVGRWSRRPHVPRRCWTRARCERTR